MKFSRRDFLQTAGIATVGLAKPNMAFATQGEDSVKQPEAIARLLLALSERARGPLLLCVDDLHWADAASLDTLAYLAKALGLRFALEIGPSGRRMRNRRSDAVEDITTAQGSRILVRAG